MTNQSSAARSRHWPRMAVRHKLFEPVVLHRKGLALRAHLIDLSVAGALAHTYDPPGIGERVNIEAEGLAVTAKVMWVRGRRFGLFFDWPLPDPVVQRLIGAA